MVLEHCRDGLNERLRQLSRKKHFKDLTNPGIAIHPILRILNYLKHHVDALSLGNWELISDAFVLSSSEGIPIVKVSYYGQPGRSNWRNELIGISSESTLLEGIKVANMRLT